MLVSTAQKRGFVRSFKEKWTTETFSVIDAGKDIDIVALSTNKSILPLPHFPSVPTDSVGVVFGGECEFLGFPFGGGWWTNIDGGAGMWFPFAALLHIKSGNAFFF